MSGESGGTKTASSITPEEEKQVQQLRALVADTEDPDNHIQDDEDVVRFLRARPTIDESAKMLRDSLKWRLVNRPWQMSCPACDEIQGFHALRQIGFDANGHALVYTCFVQCANGIGARNGAQHLIYSIENAILAMKHNDATKRHGRRGDGKWVWLLDYAGFGYQNMGMSTAKEPLQILQAHYPERLHKVVMLNAPWIFGGFFMMLKPFVDAKTYAKAAFVRGTPDEVKLQLVDLNIEGEALEWVLREMEENRKVPYPKTQKEFWKNNSLNEDSVEVSAARGETNPDANGDVHDPRGPSDWLRTHVDLPGHQKSQGSTMACRDWRSMGMPNPMIVQELTGQDIHAHYEWFNEGGGQKVHVHVTSNDAEQEDNGVEEDVVC